MKSIINTNLKYWIFSIFSLTVMSFYGSSSFAGKPTEDEIPEKHHTVSHHSGKTLKSKAGRTSSRRHAQDLKGVKAEHISELLRAAKQSGDIEVRLVTLNTWADALEQRAKVSSDPKFKDRAAIEVCKIAKSLHKDGFSEAASLRASNAMRITSSYDVLDPYKWLIS